MLKDKTERLQLGGEKISYFSGSQGTVEKSVRELTKRHSNLSKTVEYYYRWHILKPNGKRKAKSSFTVTVKTPKGAEEKAT
jgi:hypothetical protein